MLLSLLSGCELLTFKPMLPCLDTGALTSTEPALWYPDADGDGHGDEDAGQALAGDSGSWIEVGGDCDDTLAEVYPGAPELCDGMVNDCETADSWQQDIDEAGIITWEDSLNGSWQNLAWAGDVSVSEEGTIWLCRGEQDFEVNLTLDSPGALSLRTRGPDSRGASQPIETAVLRSAAADQPVVTVLGGDIFLENLSLTGASSSGDGGGLLISGGLVSLRGNKLFSNTAGRGGGLFISGGELQVESSSLHLNTAAAGAGIYAEDSVLSLERIYMYDNAAQGGPGGAAVFASSSVTVVDISIYDNDTSTVGGGFYLEDSAVLCTQVMSKKDVSQIGFSGNAVSGSTADGVHLVSGEFESGASGGGCRFEQSVWTTGGGDYVPSEPFVFSCNQSGCSE